MQGTTRRGIQMPVLPLRGMMAFPHMVLHFDVGRPKSVAALEKAMMEDQRIFLVAQMDAEIEEPALSDLCRVGTIAQVKQVLNQFDDSEADGNEMQSTWLVSEETPESIYLTKEHDASFKALSDSDRDILTGFINAGYNARELARRLGKDPSGVLKLVKRAAARLQKKIEENS